MSLEGERSGYLERKVPGKKKGRFFWFVLSGSTLFAYPNATSSAPKATYQLKGTEIQLSEKDFTVIINNEGKEVLRLISTGKNDVESWFEVLKSALDKEANEAPVKEEVKKSKVSLANRAGKTIGPKLAASPVGKTAIKNIINEETKLLLVALKRIISRVENSKKADEVENNIMKILTKAYFLDRDKKIDADEFDAVDNPMRETFEILVFMRDYRERLKPSTVDEKFKIVQSNLKKIEEIITNILINHLKPNNIVRIGMIFGLLSSINFLNEAWSDETIEDERNLLADAMNRYTQFH